MSLALILIPLIAAALAYAIPSARMRPWLLPITGAIHLGLVSTAIVRDDVSAFGGWLLLDRMGRLVLLQTSLVYFLSSLYAPGYLHLRIERDNRVLSAALLLFLSMISLHIQSQHLGLMWVALESLTLTCAPLVYFNKNPRSLEATWKYLLIGSVGIAMALLGTLFLAYSALRSGLHTSLLFDDLIVEAPKLSRPWLEAGFVLLFVGYGTKMGLAPMHTWKPDAYGEAPGIVGTLLAGCVTSCAFLAILRFYQIMKAAGDGALAEEGMIFIGLFSMAVAGAFVARQRDYKRMLAYSSVEHMGILILGIGIGGAAIFGALLHLVANSLTKGAMFLSAGNIHRAFESKSTDVVRGSIHRVPASGALFLGGFFAVTGSPPFAIFLSELTILRAAFATGRPVIGALFLVMLIVIFIGMGATVLSVVQGTPADSGQRNGFRDRFSTVAPVAAFLALALLLGVYIPPPLETLLREAAAYLGGGS
jgi:hydrogenase-4 component F